MKRILLLCLGLVLALLLVGCGQETGVPPPITGNYPSEQTTTQPAENTTPPPTTSKETTTPPPSLGYSRSDPAGLNVPLTITTGTCGITSPWDDGYEICITLTDLIRGDDAWELIEEANMFNDEPKEGYEYILAMIQLEYLAGPTSDTAYDVSGSWFDAISSAGKEYDIFFSVVEPDPTLDTSLYPGASHEGWTTFQIATDDAEPLMTFGRNSDGTGGIWFKLY